MAICPKCGCKLKITDIKPNCPKCGVNLMNYKLQQRLDADAANVEKEIIAFGKMKKSFCGVWQSAVRLVLYVMATVVLLAPMFKMAATDSSMFSGGDNVSLLSVITKIFGSEDKMAMLSSMAESKTMILISVFFVGTILLNLVSVVLSIFSYTKIGTGRNIFMTMFTAMLQIVIMAVLLMEKSVTIQPFIVLPFLVLGLIAFFSLQVKKTLAN